MSEDKKKCTKCLKMLDRSEFYPRSRNKSGLSARCKSCSPATVKSKKHCSACGKTKDISEFHKRSSSRDGRTRTCKACSNAAAKVWNAKNKDKVKRYVKKWQKKNPEKTRRMQRNAKYLRNYGISLDDYEKMYEDQNGKCLICREEFEVLAVDHCHDTGRVRGLLCRPCNFGIGNLRDDPKRLRAAVKYLTRT